MHRLPEIWGKDAEVFRPERWMDEAAPLRPGWGYLVSSAFGSIPAHPF
jgi:cytochrome P450